jgi:hypothetical protein
MLLFTFGVAIKPDLIYKSTSDYHDKNPPDNNCNGISDLV